LSDLTKENIEELKALSEPAEAVIDVGRALLVITINN